MAQVLRNSFVMFNLVFLLIVLGIPCLLVDLFDRKGLFQGWISRIWARIVLWSGNVKVEVEGTENLLKCQPAVILMNHESALDILVAIAGIPVQYRYLAKKQLFPIPFFGWLLTLGGHISVDRENPEKAIKTVNENVGKIFKKNLSVLLYPEGTRSSDGKIGLFKKGGFKLAERFDLPIIPVILLGSRYCVAKRKLSIKPGIVKLIICKPVKISEFAHLEDCINSVRDLMVKNKEKYERERMIVQSV